MLQHQRGRAVRHLRQQKGHQPKPDAQVLGHKYTMAEAVQPTEVVCCRNCSKGCKGYKFSSP